MVRKARRGEMRMTAQVAAAAFAASPVFAAIEPERYEADRIARRMRHGTTFVAVHEGAIVGCASLFPPEPASSCEWMRARESIGYVAVAPRASGHGIGDALMDFVEQVAEGPEVALSVTQRGAALIAWYERRGYRKAAEFHWPEARDPSWIMVKTRGALASANLNQRTRS